MARYRRRARAFASRTYSRARSYRRGGGGGGGGWKSMIAPLVGGAGDVVAQKWIPVNGVGSTAAGFLLKDHVTKQIGLNKIGESLGAMFAGGVGGESSGGWL